MSTLVQIEAADKNLLSAVSAAMADAERRGGKWIVCRPGCTHCCFGPFSITQLDALRLRRAMQQLSSTDPARAERIRARAAEYLTTIRPLSLLDTGTGLLIATEDFPDELNDLPCPALDQESGLCDVYEARPLTCRQFGPATRMEDNAIAACELNYVGATDEQIAARAVNPDPEGLEAELLVELERSGLAGMTVVAFALAEQPKQNAKKRKPAKKIST